MFPAVILAALALGGCYPVNPGLERYSETSGYRYENRGADPKNGEETFVVVTFSGDGTRAAAFAYGVLDELSKTKIGGDRTLLDEVDVISSVSGGSFAAAYLGLFGKEAFLRDFPEAVLYRKIERALVLRILCPWNWVKLLSPTFGHGDLADAYYDAHIFQHRTFAEMSGQRPFIVLNATDIGRGAQFSFTQEHFDRLCSDLSRVQVSRGVTASSAFPVAFTPLTLKNRGPLSCQYVTPQWVRDAEQSDFSASPQRWDAARTWRSYEDVGRRPYIHLSDGGLADNIGLRAVHSAVEVTDSWGFFAKVNQQLIKHVVVIVVDAKPRTDATVDLSAGAPGVRTVLEAAATTPMENYSSDSVEQLRRWFHDQWDAAARGFTDRRKRCEGLAAELCSGPRRAGCEERTLEACYDRLHASEKYRPPSPSLHDIHVRFDAIADPDVRKQLQGVATRLELPRDQVDLLVQWGRRLLHDSAEYQRLVQELQPTR